MLKMFLRMLFAVLVLAACGAVQAGPIRDRIDARRGVQTQAGGCASAAVVMGSQVPATSPPLPATQPKSALSVGACTTATSGACATSTRTRVRFFSRLRAGSCGG